MLKIKVTPSGCPLASRAKSAKAAALAMITSAACLMSSVASYAAETGSGADTSIFESVSTSMLDAIQSMVTSLGGLIGSIIPIALPIVGVGMVVTIGLNIFKKVTGKA